MWITYTRPKGGCYYFGMDSSGARKSAENFFKKSWRFLRLPLGIILVLYIGLVFYRVPAMFDKEKTAKTVEQIRAQKITLADVMGDALPPVPNMQENNATVAGVDANNNGIRDDVELAIFKLYPHSARIRAAELQYAMALQNELSTVFNSETLVAAIQQEGRAYLCIGDNDFRIKEVENLVFDTDRRVQYRDEILRKHMTSFSLPNQTACDLAPSSLGD